MSTPALATASSNLLSTLDEDVSGTSYDEDKTADEKLETYDENIEYEDYVSDAIPSEMLQIQEFVDLLECPEDMRFSELEKLCLVDIPESRELIEEAVKRVQAAFNVTTVILELQNLYRLLVLSRGNEQALQDALQIKEAEIQRLQERRDPKLIKALRLAESWRREKNVERQAKLEYEAAISNMKSEISNLEYKLNSLQAMNARLTKDRCNMLALEDQIKDMEVAYLAKEGKLQDLLTEVNYKKMQAENEVFELQLQQQKEQAFTGIDLTKCMQQLEMEKNLIRKRELLAAEYQRQIHDLELSLEETKRSEKTAVERSKQISTSLKTLKTQVTKIESSMRDSNMRYERLVNIHQKNERKITELEDRVRQLTNGESRLKQLLQSMHHRNETLRSQFSRMTFLEEKYKEHWHLIKTIREKEKETRASIRRQQMVTSELNVVKNELHISKQHQDSQLRQLNRSKREMAAHKESLTEAIKCSDNLYKKLELNEEMLEHCKWKMEKCTDENLDVLNVIVHLDNLCKEHERTIRIKDSKNDSLVLALSHMKQSLEESHENIGKLRKLNLVSNTNYKYQMEMNDMLRELMHFTEAEKNNAVKDYNTGLGTIVVMQKQQVMKLNKIAAQYKNICELKMSINKHLKMLDIQKKETLAVRDMLDKALQRETTMKLKIKSLIHQRDAFGHMVIQKNTHVQLLERKIIMLQNIICQGSADYKKRVSDIMLLKLEIKSLRHTLAAKKHTSEKNADLRHELISACQQLQLEQSKRKAIENMKVLIPHRHTDLMNREPSEYEKVVKIQRLQKLLIVKYDHVTDMEKTIMDRDEQLREITQILLRRTEPCLAEQFHDAKTTIIQKNKRIKGLLSEVNFLTFDLSELKKKFNEVIGELSTAKKEIAKHKRQAIQNSRPSSLLRPLHLKEQAPPVGVISHEFPRTQAKLKSTVPVPPTYNTYSLGETLVIPGANSGREVTDKTDREKKVSIRHWSF